MNIAKTVFINPVEPAALSFRAPLGIETRLVVTFHNQNGSPLTQDLAAQLQLTGRSTDRTDFYSMPSTDLANGKATAIIPAGTLNDSNGYRLRIVGTHDGSAALLAMGTVAPIAAAGPQAVPADVIDQIDLTLERGEVAEIDVRLWDDTAKSDPFDLSSAAVTAAITSARGGLVLVPFTVAVLTANSVRLTLTIGQVNALPDTCWWTLSVSAAGGATTLAEGAVTVIGEP